MHQSNPFYSVYIAAVRTLYEEYEARSAQINSPKHTGLRMKVRGWLTQFRSDLDTTSTLSTQEMYAEANGHSVTRRRR